MIKHLFFLLFAALLWTDCPAILIAQTAQTGAIAGELSAVGGNAIAVATVTAVEAATGQIRNTTTDKNGAYEFKLLPSGSYAVKFSASGHKTTVVSGIPVHVGDALVINQALSPGSQAEVVIVPWQAPANGSATGETGTQPGTPAAKDLPLSTRNYTQTTGLAPGASSQVSNATAIGMNTQGVQVGSGSTNSYLMDGAPVSASTMGPEAPGIPNPDAIAENSMQSWSYSAGPERYAGASISVTTKAGTGAFHGALFEFLRNDIFNANEFFNKAHGNPEPVLKQNQFGAALGGPIWRGKIFFFSSYQGTRQSNGLANGGYSSGVYLPPIPAGDRSSASFPQSVGARFCPDNNLLANGQYDPHYLTAIGGVQVACDGSNINPVAINYLKLKLANGADAIPGSSNDGFQQTPYSIPAKFQEDQVLFNTDYALTAKERLMERLFYSHDPQTNNFPGGPGNLPGALSTTVTANLYGVVKLVSALTPRLTSEMRISGQHNLLKDTPLVPFTNSQVGIASVVPKIDQIDSFNIMGLFSFGGSGLWDYNSINQYQWADQISWTHGNQSIRFGVEVERRQWNTNTKGSAIGSLGFLSFADFLLGLPGCPAGAANCNASNPVVYVNGVATDTNGTSSSNVFASDGPSGPTADVTGPAGIFHAYRFSDASAYLQDNFKLLSRLTVNAGVRWDYFGLPSDSTGNFTNFWPSLAGAWPALPPGGGGSYLGYVVPSNFSGALPACVTPNTCVTRSTNHTPLPIGAPSTNFVPRLGLSWQPRSRNSLVVRAGYGLFYDRPDAGLLLQQSTAEAPYAVPVGGFGTANSLASFAQPFPQTAYGWGPDRSVQSGASSNLSLGMLDENFSTPLTQKWNLEFQAQLPVGLSLVAGYAGAHSVCLMDSGRHINDPALASPTSPVYGLTTNTADNASLRVPYLGLAADGLNATQTQGSAKYNALQGALIERTSNGLHVQAAYAFSKVLSNLGGGPGPPGSVNSMNSNDPLDARQQYGPWISGPQRLAVNYGWDLPWKGSGLTGKLLGGWGVSGMTIIQSGSPITITDSRGGSIYGDAGLARAQFCAGMGARNAGTPGGVEARLNGYFNSAAFCAPPAIGDELPPNQKATGYGNSGVGFILGPGQNNTDLSLSKNFALRESKLELRVEFFNAFNHAQFNPPDQSVTDGTFGDITSTSVNPRLIQFALKYSF